MPILPSIENLEDRRLFAAAYPIGMNLNDEGTNPIHFAYSVAEMQKLGVSAVRIFLTIDHWSDRPNAWDVEPPVGGVDLNGVALPNGYGPAITRAFQLKHLGYHVLMTLSPYQGEMPASASEVTGFISHLMNRTETPTSTEKLRDVVDEWEIGNEPDSQGYWADPSSTKSTRLKSYVDKFLLPAASALHSGSSSTWEKVVSAGVSYSPEDLKTILSYLSSKNRLDAIDYAGFHPYANYDPDTGSNPQATNILLAKHYATQYGKKMVATEWNVRGYSTSGSQDTKFAKAIDLNFRNYILPNFEGGSYYFAMVNNWPGRGGSPTARTAGVLEHADSTGITPASSLDDLGDYYASKLVEAEPFFSTAKSWKSITNTPPAVNARAVVGAIWYDFSGDGVVQDNERIAGGQRVWIDLNNNSVRDAAEPTSVADSNGVFKITVPSTTSGSGKVLVESVYPQTAAPSVTIGSATKFLGLAVGIKPDFAPVARLRGSLIGTLWTDTNGNATRDANEGVANRIVYIDTNNDGTRQADEYGVLTDALGLYSLRLLPDGDYVIRVVQNAGETTQFRSLPITNEERIRDLDLLLVPAPAPVLGSISGVLFNDTDADGVFDPTETRTGARVVYIDTNANGKLDAGEVQTNSDAQGNYKFSNLSPGTYNVTRVFPSGYRLSGTTLGYIPVTVTSGQNVAGINIGSTTGTVTPPPPTTGSIGGYLWNDTNGNGVQDGAETRSGVRTVIIDTNGNGRLDSGEKSVSSDASGVYTFSNLAAGTYRITRVMPTGYRLSAPSAGYYTINLAAGASLTGYNFGSTTI